MNDVNKPSRPKSTKLSKDRTISLSAKKNSLKRTCQRGPFQSIKLQGCVPVEVFKSSQQQELLESCTCEYNDHRAWSLLPEEMVTLFLSRLSFADHIRCSAVCKPWRLAAVMCSHYQALRYPWLMFSQEQETGSFGLFSLMERKTHTLDLPVARGARCIGSSEGWLVMVDSVLGNYLLHPFSGAKILLPSNPRLKAPPRQNPTNPFERALDHHIASWQMSLMTSPNYFRKSIVSSSLSSDNTAIGDRVVLVIYCVARLAFWRQGDAHWSLVDDVRCLHGFYDIIVYKEQVYALTNRMKLVLLKFWPSYKVIDFLVIAPPEVASKNKTVYLVESAGELLMVVRLLDMPVPPIQTLSFVVYKLDLNGQRWLRTKKLGNRALLVGAGCSKSCLAEGHSGFRANCIYFTDDNCLIHSSTYHHPPPCQDLGIFCLDGGSIQPLPPRTSYSAVSPPIWFTPSLST